MSLPSLSIRRPVFILMVNALIALIGLVSIDRIGVDRLPKIEVPFVSATTTLIGASPSVIDSNITQVIESSLNSISGIDYIASTSLPSTSIVTVSFELDKNIDVAFNEVQSKIIRVFKDLPKNIELPIIEKLEVGAEPIMWLTLEGDRTLQDLNLYARNVIKKRLQNISGVGDVILGGERKRTIRVDFYPEALASFNLTPQDVLIALQREHLSLPGGFITLGNTERLVNLDLEYHDVRSLGKTIIGYRDNAPIYLFQVAKVEDDLDDKRALAQFNGRPTVGLGIIKITGANTVAIIKEVKDRLKTEIIPNLPAGMKISVAADDSFIIMDIINSLSEHLVEGTLLAALVVLLFLRNFRSTLIIAISIPISLLGAIGSMYVAGYTFNVLTLLALLLLIGVVVDDSIVVLENIYRTMEEQEPKTTEQRDEIGLSATQQVMFAVMASTFTIVSIFVPVIFLGGIIGRFFQSFAVVVTVGVLVSLFVSLSLTPMLCTRYIKIVKSHGELYQILEKGFEYIDYQYQSILAWSLGNRWKLLVITLIMLLCSIFVFSQLGKEFLPKTDEARFLINFKTPLGSSLDYTASRLNQIEKVLHQHSEVTTTFSTIGAGALGKVSEGKIYVQLSPKSERKLKQYQVMEQLRYELAQIPGVKAYPSIPAIIGGGRGEPLQFDLEGPNLKKVEEFSEELRTRLSKIPGMGTIDMDQQFNQPQYQLEIDRERAQNMGLDTQNIVEAFSILSGGFEAAKFNDDKGAGERYAIRLKTAEGDLSQPEDISRIYVRNREAQSIRMDNVAKLVPVLGPASVDRRDLLYSASFYTTPVMPLGSAIAVVNDTAKQMLPLGYRIKLSAEADEFAKTQRYITFAFVMAILLVYMVLASQFNSFIQPIALMLALPLAVIGGLISLWLAGFTLNIYSMIGMVLLMGLVAKNSILLIDLTNQFRVAGMAIDDALRTACPQRMRPVVMTSLTIILALLPAALGRGAGADTNGPLAVVIIGGMISSTLLTLVVIPAVYSLVENAMANRKNTQNISK